MRDDILNAHLDRPDGQREIDNLKRIGEVLSEAEIPVYGIPGLPGVATRPGRTPRLVPEGGAGRLRLPGV